MTTLPAPPDPEDEAKTESELRAAREGAMTKLATVAELTRRVTSRPPPPHKQ